MKKNLFVILSTALLISGCGSVPITGRKQLSLVRDNDVLASSFQQYGEFIRSAPLSTNTSQTAMVRNVGIRIAAAVETYLRNNGLASEIENYRWEFNLVRSSEVNAFCMPGGKIVVYEGILPYIKDETALAVVLGHEVAHAVAKHANERMSQEVIRQSGASIVSSAVGTSSAMVQQATALVYGLGTQGAMLKYSRGHELEADHLGLIFMAMAGYDPSQAADFWIGMAAGGGKGAPEFMSTHPSDDTRVKEINKHLPEALNYYNGATGAKATINNNIKNAPTSKKWTF